MNPRRLTRTTAALAAGVVMFAACGTDSSSDDVATPGVSSGTDAPPATEATPATDEPAATEPAATDAAPPAETDGEPVAAAPPILQFTAPLVGGGEIDATTLADRPTAFWFWSPT